MLSHVSDISTSKLSSKNGVVYPKILDNLYYDTNDDINEELSKTMAATKPVTRSTMVKVTQNPYYGVYEDIAPTNTME